LGLTQLFEVRRWCPTSNTARNRSAAAPPPVLKAVAVFELASAEVMAA
jgi:hypothetical protein